MSGSTFFGPFSVLARLPDLRVEMELPFQGFSGAVYHRIVERGGGDESWYLRQVPAAGRMLDLCCGAGRHLRAFAQAGWSATGVELAGSALDRAYQLRAALPAATAARIRLHRADARHASLGELVDCVLIGGLSFGLFGRSDRQALLRTARSHLRPGGVLLLDFSPRQEQVDDQQDVVGVPLRGAAGTGFAWIGWRRSDQAGVQHTNIYGELVRPPAPTRRYLSTVTMELIDEVELTTDLDGSGFRIADRSDRTIAAGAETMAMPVHMLACEALR
ncbi:class I SAM-dependent methyltransferase [Solwaraspora sp. WMMB335]|uniref:class I SAM-dependent methyltransferase n=1 Tax=Solwaraspora sp. WMMB335 TaxID=3404118 RepID=UPI003B927DDD